ncbi:MAG: RsmD family RNA methyltransferase [Thermoguttaceae bacterium]
MARQKRETPRRGAHGSTVSPVGLRIIGGEFRGRKLRYGGDPRVRPMKDRVRESVFNLLGVTVKGKHAVDLFAGTGALGLEALSRGAIRATFIEQHHPTARVLDENIATLGAGDRAEVVRANVFLRVRWQSHLGSVPWVVFCSPPYVFYAERQGPMLDMIAGLLQAAPPESPFVVEADQQFDFRLLPNPDAWDIRVYPPAVVGIYHKP